MARDELDCLGLLGVKEDASALRACVTRNGARGGNFAGPEGWLCIGGGVTQYAVNRLDFVEPAAVDDHDRLHRRVAVWAFSIVRVCHGDLARKKSVRRGVVIVHDIENSR